MSLWCVFIGVIAKCQLRLLLLSCLALLFVTSWQPCSCHLSMLVALRVALDPAIRKYLTCLWVVLLSSSKIKIFFSSRIGFFLHAAIDVDTMMISCQNRLVRIFLLKPASLIKLLDAFKTLPLPSRWCSEHRFSQFVLYCCILSLAEIMA